MKKGNSRPAPKNGNALSKSKKPFQGNSPRTQQTPDGKSGKNGC
jgi:hypothetical protein